MLKKAIGQCCRILSMPFKKQKNGKDYHTLNGETPKPMSPPRNFISPIEITGRTIEKEDDKATLGSSFDLEEALNNAHEKNRKEELIELTTINLENPMEKYVKLGNEITRLMHSKIMDTLQEFDQVYKDDKNPHHLTIFIKSYLSEKKSRINIVRSEWIAPCPPERLLAIMNDIEEQKKIAATTIDQFYSYENFGTNRNFHLMYLRYKKIMIASARDFVYLKCYNQIDDAKNIWIDCSKSIEDDRYPENSKDTVRGSIMISGTYLEGVEIDGVKCTKVISYSEIDFKMNLPLALTKPTTVSEFRKYVDKTIEIVSSSN